MRHLTYANVVATLALFLALTGGVVYAAGQIGSSDLAKRAVKTQNIAANAVKTPQIKNNSVNSGDIRDQNITGEDLADSTIETADLKDGAVKGGKVADDSLTGADLQDGTIGPNDLAVTSGRTVRGVIGASYAVEDTSAGVQGTNAAYASFPIPVPTDLTDSDLAVVHPDSIDSGQVACAGSAANPTAPLGKVCIYVVGADFNETAFQGVAVGSGAASRYGFAMRWGTDDSALPTRAEAVWAYTAP